MSLGRYLSPEPLLQDPNWVRDEAQDGFSTPTYAYARNNPLRYTDPTGLYAWIDECEGGGIYVFATFVQGGDDRGRNQFPGLQFEPTSSTVQFWTGNQSACADFNLALRVQKTLQQGGYGHLRACWRKLIRQMSEACKGIERPPKQPEPPAGYCRGP
jgi:hypothetical protein